MYDIIVFRYISIFKRNQIFHHKAAESTNEKFKVHEHYTFDINIYLKKKETHNTLLFFKMQI